MGCLGSSTRQRRELFYSFFSPSSHDVSPYMQSSDNRLVWISHHPSKRSAWSIIHMVSRFLFKHVSWDIHQLRWSMDTSCGAPIHPCALWHVDLPWQYCNMLSTHLRTLSREIPGFHPPCLYCYCFPLHPSTCQQNLSAITERVTLRTQYYVIYLSLSWIIYVMYLQLSNGFTHCVVPLILDSTWILKMHGRFSSSSTNT